VDYPSPRRDTSAGRQSRVAARLALQPVRPFSSYRVLEHPRRRHGGALPRLWWDGRFLRGQLYFQIAVDLLLTTILVAQTRGADSTFASFYLLIIIYCSMTLGRDGGMAGAALSTILYAGIVTADHLGITGTGIGQVEPVRSFSSSDSARWDSSRSRSWERTCPSVSRPCNRNSRKDRFAEAAEEVE